MSNEMKNKPTAPEHKMNGVPNNDDPVRGEYERLRKEHQELQTDYDKMRGHLEDWKDQYNKLRQIYEETKQRAEKLENFETIKAGLEREIESLKHDLDMQKHVEKTYKEEIKKIQEEKVELEYERDEASKGHTHFQDQVEEVENVYKQQVDALKERIEEVEQSKRQWRQEAEKLGIKLGREKEDHERLKQRFEEIKDSKDGSASEEKLLKENRDLKTRLAQLETQMKQIQVLEKNEDAMDSKIFIPDSQDFAKADKKLMEKVYQQFSDKFDAELQVTADMDPTSPAQYALLFCMARNPLSLEFDVETCLSKAKLNGLTKSVVVVLHHVRKDKHHSIKSSEKILGEQVRTRLNVTKFVDCVFWDTNGPYECDLNQNTVDELVQFFGDVQLEEEE